MKKLIRKKTKDRAALGYTPGELSPRVVRNLDFAIANIKSGISERAVLEGCYYAGHCKQV